MKKNLKMLFVQITIIIAGLLNIGAQAQTINLINSNAATMKLSGTSTFHNWCMNGTFLVDGNFKVEEGTHQLQSLNGLTIKLPVENLKSEKKKLDETAYKALKTDQYKDIQFVMSSATITSVVDNKYYITALGNLTIAGVTKPIMMNVSWTMNSDNTITCTGSQKLKMTDYQVDPPSFLGFMKTGDDISLDFSFQFKS